MDTQQQVPTFGSAAEILRSLVDSSPDHIMLLDLEGRIRFINRTVSDLTVSQVLGTKIYNYVDSQFHDGMRACFEQVERTGEIGDFHVEFQTADGDTRTFESRVGPVYHDDEVVGFSCISRDVTERERAAGRLRESEALFRSLSGSSPDHIVLTDCAGTIQFVNHTVPQVTPEEMIGTSMLEHLEQEFRPTVRDAMQRSISSGEVVSYTIEYNVPDGERVIYQCRMGPRQIDGRVVGLTINARDVTALLRMQESMRRASDFRAAIIGTAAEGICAFQLIDEPPHVRFSVWNAQLERITGYTMEEINRLGWQRTIFPDEEQQRRAARRMEQLRAGDHSRNEEWTITRKDGQRRLLAISTSSFEDDDGIEAVVALMHDVTERKRSESALRESQRENQLLLEAIPDMMMRVRRDGTYVGFKYPRDFQPWKHETRSQIIGSNIRNSVPPEISELALECIAAALDTSQTQHFQYTIPVGGQRRHREARVVPAAEDEVLIIIRDTTQRRQAEEQRDLAEQRLVQQQEQLAHVSRLSAVGEMVAGIAHEITQPLGAISNYASAAATTLERQAALDSEVIRWNQQIAEQASRAGQIIDRLRRFAQRGEPRREPHSLCEVIREGIALVQANARRRRANISFAAPAKPITINADRVQVQQVLVNLLNNALEAMAHQPQSRRTAEVSVDVDERGCRVAVSDDGCGLPREAQDKIFEAFYTTKPDGMGMGLAICRTIIEGHGGQLQAKANPTGGAIVYFTLPRQS